MTRQYFWWPKIDKEIESYVKECEACRATASNPSKSSLIKFLEAEFPFNRVYIDFARSFKDCKKQVLCDPSESENNYRTDR